MWAWLLLFAVMILVTLFTFGFIVAKLGKFSCFRKVAKERKWRFRGIAFAILVVIFAVLSLWLEFMNALIVFIHLLIFWLIADLIEFVIQKIRKAEKKIDSPYYLGGIVIAFTVVYLGVGAYLDYNVWEKDYTVTTDKEVGNFRVAMFADSHVGTTFDGDGFAKKLEQIQETNPDVLIIAGDFVDDGTSKEDMQKCCEALGEFDAPHGVYYTFGNHDKGYYTRDYSGQDIVNALEKNGVMVLQDEAVLVDDRFYIIGRQDKSEEMRGSNRKSMEDLMSELDDSKYSIVVDHQPQDYERQSKAEVNLVLSGHTHGGQLFPLRYVEQVFASDNQNYGIMKQGNTNFIVTSGISDWAIKFKTGCKSEFVIVNIEGK